MTSLKLILIVVFGLHVRRHAIIASDWVKLSPIHSIGDSLNIRSDGLLDSAFPIRTTTTDHPLDLHRIGLAAQSQLHHHVPPIKYEDLEHIVGPGFEQELERYYDQHKHDLEESTRRTSRPHHQSPPVKVYNPSEDPWSIYDKPISTQTTSSFFNTSVGDQFSMVDTNVPGKPTVVTFVTKPSKTNSQFDTTTSVNPTDHSNSSAKKHVKTKLFKLVQVPILHQHQKPTSSLFGFSTILQFFRKIQNSFVTNSSRSIQDKIKMLESFRDDLMGNIKTRISKLWPTTSKTVRTKRDVSDYWHDGMDFPSSEGALMTISFLTFAVFLIKLVLQVINTIKSKHYSYNSFDTSSVSVATIKENRNARSLRHEMMDDENLFMESGSKMRVYRILDALPSNHNCN